MAAEDGSFRQAMRLLSGGVVIIAARLGAERGGLTATAVCSFALDPPRILVCINPEGRTYRMISETRRMSVNVLAHGQEDLAKSFAGATDRHGEDRFAEGDWQAGASGAPFLADALMALDCTVVQSIRYDTKAILIGRVETIHMGKRRPPLVYADGAFTTIRQHGRRDAQRDSNFRFGAGAKHRRGRTAEGPRL